MRFAVSLIVAGVLMTPTAVPVAAQAMGPVAQRWNVGLKLADGIRYPADGSQSAPHPWTAYGGGITGGYGFLIAGTFLTVQADALLERREGRPWQTASAANTALAIPVYFRTHSPTSRLHLLLGASTTLWLTGFSVPENERRFYATRPVEIAGLAGVEVRLLPLSQYETTVALSYRPTFSPNLIHYRAQMMGSPVVEDIGYHWFGVSLNLYFHPLLPAH